MKNNLISYFIFMISTVTFAQIGIGTNTPASSSILDLTSTNKGLLLPRVPSTTAITAPANGLIIYDLSANCLKVYQNGAWSNCLGTSSSSSFTVSDSDFSVDCTGFTGKYCPYTLSGTTYVVTITNKTLTAKQFTPQIPDLTLYGVAGVSVSDVNPKTATTINPNTSLTITYTISGTPVATGNLTGSFTKQLLNCSSTVEVVDLKTVSTASATPTLCINTPLTPITHITKNATGIGTVTGLPTGLTASWANNTITISGTPTVLGTFNYSIPVAGGCGPDINATGTINIPNLTVLAVSANPTAAINAAMTLVTHTTTNGSSIGTPTGLPPGLTAAWSSNTITISGTPTVLGTYNYTIPVNGCGPVINTTGTITVVTCGAFVAVGTFKAFACHNLGVTNTTLDPNIPVQAIQGSYYQWGRKTTSTSTSVAADGAWLDNSKTTNDSCPVGYKVPTKTQWDGVVSNNTISRTGTWTKSNTNYGTAIHFGPNSTTKTLTLPAAGYEGYDDGTLSNRGSDGFYWSSTQNTTPAAFYLTFNSSNAGTSNNSRNNGCSIRCISE